MSEDNQAEEIEASAPEPKPEPLFTLDLGANGGVLAPTSYGELKAWLEEEIKFWSWGSKYKNNSNLDSPGYWLDQGCKLLSELKRNVSNSEHFIQNGVGGNEIKSALAAESILRECQNKIRQCYIDRRFPYSGTPLAKRIKYLQINSGDIAAIMYAAVHLHPTDGQYSIYGQQLPGWRGLVEGLIDRHDLIGAISEGRQQAAEASFEELRNKAELLVTEKDKVCNALHQRFEELTATIHLEAVRQAAHFDDWGAEFEKLKQKHQQDMEQLRKTFNEEMGLRAPALYWKDKQATHKKWSKNWGIVSFSSIALAAGGLGWLIHDLLKNTPANTAPETWRLAVLALVAVFTVWGVRLIVRLFLSHQHLYTDAQERITMVQTYLSLMEGEHLASRNDRQLILQALFRPASDGLVKDEGVPFSLAEVITRQGKP